MLRISSEQYQTICSFLLLPLLYALELLQLREYWCQPPLAMKPDYDAVHAIHGVFRMC